MAAELTSEQKQALSEALFGGRKIEAIKQVRDITGLDLKDSKELVERLEADLRASQPGRFAAPPKKSGGCLLLVILLFPVAVIIFWILFKR